MPRVVPRAAFWAALTSGALALAGLGLGWSWWHRDSDFVARGASAYAASDFSRAADWARRRLKAAPGDVEALRLLARSTARLGRDVPANALFARLGSAALQAEDLYLVGLGLDRAGQREAAVRVWEKALGLQPDHAETIERLIPREVARNRIAQAAQLAERLAGQPGWELRGELDLAMLRAELSDPAGAASVLGRALERPEAARLDPPERARARKLLARTLLRAARPAEARAILQKVLHDGPDPEASWLLSRAALQQGAFPEAAVALEAAGPYRLEHPLESEPSPFVGEARCAECHRDTFRAVQASRHASTLVRGTALTGLPYPDRPLPDPDDPTVTHAFRHRDDRVLFETRTRDAVRHAVVAYAFGSPDHYVSLVGHDDRGAPYILRLSHYRAGRDAGWVRTTGHSPDAGEGHDFLGKPIDPLDGVQKCLFCHATDPRAVLDRSGPAAADRAIGCERCHGPGGHHLRSVAAKFPDPAIVSPAAGAADGRIRLCGQCHSHHQELTLPRTDPFWIRFQGTTLPWSRCYTDSAGSLDCTTCHDPHHDVDRSGAHYNAQCLTCHAGGSATETRAAPRTSHDPSQRAGGGLPCPVNPADGCVGCHMPPFESKPLHATFTDHYIRVHPELKPGAPK
jgi:tetratricopeptide (TPR) repeat protein